MDGLSFDGEAEPYVIPDGKLGVVVVASTAVTRYKDATSSVMRKDGVLTLHTAVYISDDRTTVGGVDRVRIVSPSKGWVDASDVVVGQICVVRAPLGATVRSGIEVDSDIVGTVENERRVFVIEKAETSDGRVRVQIASPLAGWISAKCVVVVEDISGNLLGVGREVLDGSGGEEKGERDSALYSNYTAVDHDAMYKALYDAGLQYGPGFRLCRKAWRTDHDAVGMLGPVPGETTGWLVHPALADSMLHLTAIAPKAPEGGWPWLAEEEK
ncbi:hypothetical protein M885DRAFT_586619 [Pelagophyceae sp. CCMP2097]|nr:hypothetical protein M885DRAFT_586619 [Pelagophyceae sp. CCMP2097]